MYLPLRVESWWINASGTVFPWSLPTQFNQKTPDKCQTFTITGTNHHPFILVFFECTREYTQNTHQIKYSQPFITAAFFFMNPPPPSPQQQPNINTIAHLFLLNYVKSWINIYRKTASPIHTRISKYCN